MFKTIIKTFPILISTLSFLITAWLIIKFKFIIPHVIEKKSLMVNFLVPTN